MSDNLPDNLPDTAMSEIRVLLQQRQLIQAVKVYRTATGCGLKDAKEAVEQLWDRFQHDEPATFPARSEFRAAGKTWTLLAAVVIFVAIYSTVSVYVFPRLASGEPVSPNARLEFRELRDQPFDGSKEFRLPDGQSVQIGTEALLQPSDLSSFQVIQTSDSDPQLKLTLRSSAMTKIAAIPSDSSSQPNAALGLFVNSQLVARTSTADVSDETLLIELKGLSSSEANEISARLTE